MLTRDKLSYRVDDAADATGLSRSKIYDVIKAGELETVKLGRATLIPRRSLEKLVGQAEAG